MVQRKILLIGLFALGVIIFAAGIISGSVWICLLGVVVALPSAAIGIFLFLYSARMKVNKKEYKSKLRVIYRLIPQKTFENNHFYTGPTGAVKSASFEIERKERENRSKPIKYNAYSNFTKEKVLTLIKKFYFGYQSPERIRDYFFAAMDKFPCGKKTTQTFRTILDANVSEINEQLDVIFTNMWTTFIAQAKHADEQNLEILKNHKPTETTGLGFGIITNSATNLAVYAAMDADERKWQELSNAPQLKDTEKEDSEILADTYEKCKKLYQDFMVNTAILFSQDKLYLNSER